MSSNFSDNSLIREKVTADIFREAGVPSAQTAFYRLFIDYGEGSKYFGLYTMVEIPDYPMFQTQFKADGGNLYKPSGNGARFVEFNQNSFPIKTNEENSNWNDIKAIFSSLHASREDAAAWRAGLEKVFDARGFIRWLAVNSVIENWDTYGAMSHNYYLYNDPGDGIIHWIPWDNNMSLGFGSRNDAFPMPAPENANIVLPATNALLSPSPSISPVPSPLASPQNANQNNQRQMPGGAGGMGRGLSINLTSQEVGNNWPLIRYLIDDPVYKALYVTFVEETINGAFGTEKTKARFKNLQDMIRPYVVGAEGEITGYTLLNSSDDFGKSLDILYKHVETQHEEANKFLSENK